MVSSFNTTAGWNLAGRGLWNLTMRYLHSQLPSSLFAFLHFPIHIFDPPY